MERTWKDVTSILKLSELNFPFPGFEESPTGGDVEQVNIVESALFEAHENMHCSITVSVGFLYLLLIMCIYLDFI